MTRTFLALITIAAVSIALAQDTSGTRRTVETSNFLVTWNTGADTEAITSLEWMGGSNLTGTLGVDTCGGLGLPGNVDYFGNSEAPPDPQSGGLVLVGGGTITPAGAIPWSAQILVSGVEVTINSNSTNCPPSSAGINVQTTYRFFNPNNANTSWFGVQRVFDFTATPFSHDFRPYVPRLDLSSGYTEVLYPTPAGKLATMDVSSCPYGCTGPRPAPGAAQLNPLWDSRQGWFAIHNPSTLPGVVVSRVPSTDPQGNAIAAQLWIDNDGGPPGSNPSSFLLVNPTAGFGGGLVTEVETLCFYDSSIWTPSLIPPPACKNTLIPITLSPSELTFAAQSAGTTSLPQTATLSNTGTESVRIAGIVSSGDFAQANNCPASLAVGASCEMIVSFKPSAAGIRSGSVSIVSALKTSPQTLSLAGLGLPAAQ